jgi:hypothetical protein
MMTEDEWQYEAKTLKNTLLHHRDVVERFAENAFKFIPGFNARIETKELFEHILLGIEELSIKKDDLITKNKDLHSAIEKKSYNKSIIEEFCAGTMQWFPHLQTKYEVCNLTLSFYLNLGVTCILRLNCPFLASRSAAFSFPNLALKNGIILFVADLTSSVFQPAA